MVAIAQNSDSLPVPPAKAAAYARQLALLQPISLGELGQDNLQDRVDTKFLFTASELPSLLESLVGYRVLEIGAVRQHGYQTLYFDTPDFDLYYAQHNGRQERYKVRTRCYVETHQSFLEVKQKDSKARTIKNRVATGSLLTELDDESTGFVAQHLPFSADGLEPKLWNRYSRITLAGDALERVTIDFNIGFGEDRITAGFPGLIIAELKQETLNRDSEFLRQMRLRNIHQTSFSKYCVGVAVLNTGLKHNLFKPNLLRAQRLSQGYLDNE